MSTYYDIYMFKENKDKTLDYIGAWKKKSTNVSTWDNYERELNDIDFVPAQLLSGQSYVGNFLREIGTWELDKDAFYQRGLNKTFDYSKYEDEYSYINYGEIFTYDDLAAIKGDGRKKGCLHKDFINFIEMSDEDLSGRIQEILDNWTYNRDEDDDTEYVISKLMYEQLLPENKQNYAPYEWTDYESVGYIKGQLMTAAMNWYNENVPQYGDNKIDLKDIVFYVTVG